MYDPNAREVRTVQIDPDDPRYTRAGKAYNDEFRSYVSTGRADERTLKLAEGDKGGVIAPMQVAARFIQKLDDDLHIRRISNSVMVENAGSLGVMGIEDDPSDAEWTSEVSDTDAAADTDMKFGKRELSPNLLIKRLDISKTMLNRLPRVESILVDRLAYRTGRAEENGFINGTGSSQPLGVFTAGDSGLPTSRDVNLGSTSAPTTDGLIKMQMALKEGHRRRGKWLLGRAMLEKVRLLKDAENRYIWRPGLTDDMPAILLGKEICESELAPSVFTSGKYVAVFGNFEYYMIATALNLSIFRDPYTAAGKNKQRFFVYHESDGMPVLAEAFSRGKLSA